MLKSLHKKLHQEMLTILNVEIKHLQMVTYPQKTINKPTKYHNFQKKIDQQALNLGVMINELLSARIWLFKKFCTLGY